MELLLFFKKSFFSSCYKTVYFFVSRNNFVIKHILTDINVPIKCDEEVKTTEFDDVLGFGNIMKHIGMISRFGAWLTAYGYSPRMGKEKKQQKWALKRMNFFWNVMNLKIYWRNKKTLVATLKLCYYLIIGSITPF